MNEDIITIGMADDHEMIRQSIKFLIEGKKGFKVIMEADNGKHLIEKIESASEIPEILLIDISMPIMNGYDTISHITSYHPDIKSIALSINDDVNSVFKMIENGARAYLRKGCSTKELIETIKEVHYKGIYYDNFVAKSFIDYQHQKIGINSTETLEKESIISKLTDRELEFIGFACSDLTYKGIAGKMQISKRTVDSHREAVFDKLKIKSRVALAIFAIENNLHNKKTLK